RALARAALPRNAGRVQQHPKLPARRARAPAARPVHDPNRGRNLHLGRAARGPTERRTGPVDRAGAGVGPGALARGATGAVTFGVWLRLGRVSNLPTVWTNTLAGSVLAGSVLTGEASTPSLSLSVGLCLALSAFY